MVFKSIDIISRSAILLAACLTYSDSWGREVFLEPWVVARESGKPVVATRTFEAYTTEEGAIRVRNGSNGLPVTSAQITVNGQTVLLPDNFKKSVTSLEETISLQSGINLVEVEVRGKPGSSITIEIVDNPDLKKLSQSVADSAQKIRESFPGAQLRFSQLHGALMYVQADTISDDPLRPLAESRGNSDQALASAMLEFLEQFKDVYDIGSPKDVLRIPIFKQKNHPVNVQNGHNLPSAKSPGDETGQALTLYHTYAGLRIDGRFATGLFDEDGNLQALLTRLLPVNTKSASSPALKPEQALNEIDKQLDIFAGRDSELGWLTGTFNDAQHVEELLWMPISLNMDSALRLAYKVTLRNSLNEAIVLVDAQTGQVMRAYNTTPSDWFDDGQIFRGGAPDETGATRTIPFVGDDDTFYMGFGSNLLDVGAYRYFRPGQHFDISDTTGKANLALTYNDVITIPQRIGSADNFWGTDPSYIGNRRAATSLMDSVNQSLLWWAKNLNWLSWDGRQSALRASVNNNKQGGARRDLNAWGSGGIIQIGDGTTASGATYASSAEIVGHEFTHGVISATSKLRYLNESGALNESLADFFGSAVTSIGDAFNNTTFGEETGQPLRDLQDPTIFRQPDQYSNFFVTSSDAGGVHTNSGILNKAHWLVVQGGTFRGFTVPAIGVSRTARHLHSATVLRVYPQEASMEEFSVAIVGYCSMMDALGRATGGDRINDLCESLRRAYSATQLLPGSNDADLSLDSVIINSFNDSSKSYKMFFTNQASGNMVDLSAFQLTLADEVGDIIELVPGFTSRSCPTRRLSAGDSGCVSGILDSGFIEGYLMTGRRLSFGALPFVASLDTNMSNNFVSVHVAPDYTFGRGQVNEDASSMETHIIPNSRNSLGGFPEGLSAVILERNTANGPLTILGDEDTIETTTDSITMGFPQSLRIPYDDQGRPTIKDILVTGAFELPGLPDNDYQVWFDESGGLPELDGQRQLYVLLDSNDLINEPNETNNLFCLNCRAPAQREIEIPPGGFASRGVLVRLPEGVDVSSMFPENYQDAAAKLPAEYPRLFDIREVIINTLPIAILPEDISLPPLF